MRPAATGSAAATCGVRTGLGARGEAAGPRASFSPSPQAGTRHAATPAHGEDQAGAHHAVRPRRPAPPPRREPCPGRPLGYRVCPPTPDRCPWDAHSASSRASSQRPSWAHLPSPSPRCFPSPAKMLLLVLQDSPPQTGQGAGARQALPLQVIGSHPWGALQDP